MAAHTKLILASSALLTVEVYELNSEGWPFLSREISPEAFTQISAITLIYLAVSYTFSYAADMAFFRSWASRSQFSSKRWGGDFEDPFSKVHYAAHDCGNLLEGFKELIKKQNEVGGQEEDIPKFIDELAKEIDDLKNTFDGIYTGFRRIQIVGWLYISIWCTVLPIGAFVTSMVFLFR